jgi:hypothetical protein
LLLKIKILCKLVMGRKNQLRDNELTANTVLRDYLATVSHGKNLHPVRDASLGRTG